MTCNSRSSWGSVCVLPEQHSGVHRAVHGFEWTDDSDRAAAEQTVKQMGGRTD